MTIHAIGLTTLNNTAKDFRNDMSVTMFGATAARPTGGRSGVRYGTPTNTVSLVSFAGTIKPHSGIMDVQTAAAAGPYFYAVTANEAFTVSAAHATLPRVDIVTIRINDNVEDASGLESATAHYKAGTAAASPVAPSPDTTRELIIATIAVPASGGGNPTVSWVAPYAVAAGGIIPVRTTTDRNAMQTAYPGTTDAPLVVWRKDVAAFDYNDGTGWRPMSGAYRPTNAAALTALSSAYTLAAGDKAYQIDTGIEYWYSGSAWLVNMPGLNLLVPTSVAGSGVTVSNKGVVTISAATTASLNGVFTSRFTNYRVIVDTTAQSAVVDIAIKLRLSGTDAATNYNWIRGSDQTSSRTVTTTSATTGGVLGSSGQGRHMSVLDFSRPAEAVSTLINVQALSAPTMVQQSIAIYHSTATAYDGFTLAPTSGTFTGTIRVYGYNE